MLQRVLEVAGIPGRPLGMLPGVIPRDRAVSSMHQAASDRLCRPSRASCAVCRSSKASVRRPGASPARQPVSFAGVCECTSRRCLQVRHPSSGECCVRARSADSGRRGHGPAMRPPTQSRRADALLVVASKPERKQASTLLALLLLLLL